MRAGVKSGRAKVVPGNDPFTLVDGAAESKPPAGFPLLRD